MSHTNILTCSIIHILYFHHLCVYSAPEKITVAICRCLAVLQPPEKRKSRGARHPLPSAVFLHCYLCMQHLKTTVRITTPLYLCNWTLETAAEWGGADGNAKMLQLVGVSCKLLPGWEFTGKASLCKSSVPTLWYLYTVVCHQRQRKESLSSKLMWSPYVSLEIQQGVMWLKRTTWEHLWIQILT